MQRGSHEVDKAAAASDGCALEVDTEDLMGDREVALAAVATRGFTLDVFTEELKGDLEVVKSCE